MNHDGMGTPSPEEKYSASLRDIGRSGLGDMEMEALAMKCAVHNPDATLAAMSADTEGNVTSKSWSVDVFREAAKAATKADSIFGAFSRLKGKESVADVLADVADRFPEQTGQNILVYVDLPEAEAIFSRARAKDSKAAYYGSLQFEDKSNRKVVDTHEWVQRYIIEDLESHKSPASIFQSAKKFGDAPWFQPLLERLPEFVATTSDYNWLKWRLDDKNEKGEFPPGIFERIKQLASSISQEGLVQVPDKQP